MCASKRYVHPGVQKKSDISPKSLRHAGRYRIFITYISHRHPHKAQRQTRKICCEILPLLASSLHPLTRSLLSGQKPVLSDSEFSFMCTQMLLTPFQLPAVLPLLPPPLLPPGEEGSSALETLRVRLAVCSLRCSGCFNDYWGHLD